MKFSFWQAMSKTGICWLESMSKDWRGNIHDTSNLGMISSCFIWLEKLAELLYHRDIFPAEKGDIFE